VRYGRGSTKLSSNTVIYVHGYASAGPRLNISVAKEMKLLVEAITLEDGNNLYRLYDDTVFDGRYRVGVPGARVYITWDDFISFMSKSTKMSIQT